MRFLILFILFLATLNSQTIYMPSVIYNTSGGVSDLVMKDTKLYVATDSGCVDIFLLHNPKKIESICVEKIVDFMGDAMDSKIYSIDVIDESILILSQDNDGFRRLHLYENKTLKELISKDAKLSIAKAKFLDKNRIIIALLGNELLLYETNKKETFYQVQVSQSKFSNFTLDEAKNRVVIADESGELKIYDTQKGTLLQSLNGQNLDNVFQVDMKNEQIITAGQDRRVALYNLKKQSALYLNSSFLVYVVALSPSANIGAYSSDEYNNITLFDTTSQRKLGVFGGNNTTLTNILFLDEKSFFVGSDDKKLHFYKIP